MEWREGEDVEVEAETLYYTRGLLSPPPFPNNNVYARFGY